MPPWSAQCIIESGKRLKMSHYDLALWFVAKMPGPRIGQMQVGHFFLVNIVKSAKKNCKKGWKASDWTFVGGGCWNQRFT